MTVFVIGLTGTKTYVMEISDTLEVLKAKIEEKEGEKPFLEVAVFKPPQLITARRIARLFEHACLEVGPGTVMHCSDDWCGCGYYLILLRRYFTASWPMPYSARLRCCEVGAGMKSHKGMGRTKGWDPGGT